ncbi:Glycosyltransferase involved in cell wall bisynthesis [Catalinimonas alkaloidigena]|uniref:Glycosyltransferase involved in cell wall bisynthesis n=1 Tax=Catalinimonas alkaloidigena TaxID=1075417 RepID=A0A1G9D8D6_9BACT|nr:glycosyltransferase family 2 protein [Catalinimonas alkaloidigena]SDK60121.1 Glycosyltransferase involved in cell wall bisynthesis [Catalinimonas alkaloidigena]
MEPRVSPFYPVAEPEAEPLLSLVVTLYNEEENIRPLLERIHASLEGYTYEVILVDDGSTDDTVAAVKRHADERVRLLIFNRNYGQTTAMAAGIDEATGRYVVTLDGDLQNDPADIPAMLEKLEAGSWDVVAGRRANRQDKTFSRKIPSRIANFIIRRMTGVHINDYGCSLKIFKRDIAQGMGLYGELHRFIPVLAALQGARITQMDVHHHPRLHGKSKYGIGRTGRVISDMLLMAFFQKYLQRPMHLFGPVGLGAIAIGLLINFYLLIVKLLGNDIWGRPLLLLGVMLFLGGIQILTIGIVAELIMRTYFESQHKKTYRIREVFRGQRGQTP